MIEIVNKIVNFYKCGFNINNNKNRIEDYQYIQNIISVPLKWDEFKY